MFQRFQLHSILKGFLAGQDFLTLVIGIDHDNRNLVIIQRPYKHRHRFSARQLAPVLALVACHDLIATLLPGPDDARNENAILRYVGHCLLHRFIIPHMERMIFEGE